MRVVVLQLADPGLLPPAALLHRAQRQLQRVQARLGEVGSGGGSSHVSQWRFMEFEARNELFHFLSFQIQIQTVVIPSRVPSLLILLSVMYRENELCPLQNVEQVK